MTGLERRTGTSRRSTVGAVVLSALLSMALVGCGSSGSDSANANDSSRSGGPPTTLAPATGPAFDLAAAKAAIDQLAAFEGDMTVTLNDGEDDLRVSSAHMTVDRTHNRTRAVNAATEINRTAYNVVSEGNDLYVAKSDQWTKLSLDPSLVSSAPGASQVTSIADLIEKTGAELRQDGSVVVNQQTWKKYRANVDGDKAFNALTSKAAMTQLGPDAPTFEDKVGAINVEVDETNLIRSMTLTLSFLADGDPGSITMSLTRQPLPADTVVDLPPADQIVETKSIATAEELGTAMRAAIS